MWCKSNTLQRVLKRELRGASVPGEWMHWKKKNLISFHNLNHCMCVSGRVWESEFDYLGLVIGGEPVWVWLRLLKESPLHSICPVYPLFPLVPLPSSACRPAALRSDRVACVRSLRTDLCRIWLSWPLYNPDTHTRAHTHTHTHSHTHTHTQPHVHTVLSMWKKRWMFCCEHWTSICHTTHKFLFL